MSDDNIIDFEELIDREFNREDEAMLRAERDAVIVFMQRSSAHARFVMFALTGYVERIRHHSTAKQDWPFTLTDNNGWIDLAEELWTDLEECGQ